MKIKDKIVIITGASSGIGYEIAKDYVKEGAKVYGMARREERLNELKEEVKDYPGKFIPFVGDVGSDEDIENIFKQVMEENDRLDILVNNAGILDNYKSIENVDDETWDRVMNINVNALMKTMRKAIPQMRKQKYGVILNTTSVGGLHGMRGGVGYVASKHAVVGMTKNIGFQYGQEGIRCVAVAPGTVSTEIGGNANGPDGEVLSKLMAGFNLMPVVGEPESVAKLFTFLASDDASFINGTVVVADGGWTAF